jgi:Ca-activated chloride channel family protein
VTALLELELHEGATAMAGDVATVAIRSKEPGGTTDRELTSALAAADVRTTFDEASDATRFAAAIAEYAEILRGSQFSEGARFDDVRAIAAPLVGDDADRAEFLELLDLAATRRR